MTPSQSIICDRCNHMYGRHSMGMNGPCQERVGQNKCDCPHFLVIDPNIDAEMVYARLREEDP